jgi:hypothetical protein
MKKTNSQPFMKKTPTDWDFIREKESCLLRGMTEKESLLQYQDLLTSFEWQLEVTSDLFSTERQQALIEIQNRLRLHGLWQFHYGKSISIHPKDSETPV